MSNKSKKVLRIKTSVFLKKAYSDRVETCNHIKDAMDLNELSMAQLSDLLGNLYNAGYREVKVMELK